MTGVNNSLNLPIPHVDGQLLIGSSSGAPALATLTQGANITITNAANSITISSSGGGGGGFTSVTAQIFFTAGSFTYTPTSGMAWCQIIAVGGAGGGGGAQGGTGTTAAGAGGNAGQSYTSYFSAATIGASQTGTIGSAGSAGSSSGGDGGAGGTTSIPGLSITCTGGAGGTGALASTAAVYITANTNNGGGTVGGYGISTLLPLAGVSGCGATPPGILQIGNWAGFVGSSTPGGSYSGNLGCGGSGGLSLGATGYAGKAGSAGLVFVIEYIA